MKDIQKVLEVVKDEINSSINLTQSQITGANIAITKIENLVGGLVEKLVMPKYTDTWQLCPKCNGQGTVTKPPHIQGDQTQWTTSATSFICDVCNGNKIIKR